MSLVNLLLSMPLATGEDRAEKIGPAAGVPIFGLDALGSAAYGPEAALTILIPLGLAGAHYIVPISACIIALLAIVYFSYRQTIEAYPTGGGSYTVASQNLGPFAGLLAASALMVDYALVVAVGISAGIGALVSALPNWQPYTLELCLAVLAMISIVNLRGVRDVRAAFRRGATEKALYSLSRISTHSLIFASTVRRVLSELEFWLWRFVLFVFNPKLAGPAIAIVHERGDQGSPRYVVPWLY